MELDNYNCVLCHFDIEETLLHLFFHCPFVVCCWSTLGLAPLIEDDLLNTLSAFRSHLQQPFFMDIIICMCWAIWIARNDSIFIGLQHSLTSCKFTFRKELVLVNLRAKSKYQPKLDQWLEGFV